MRTHSTQRAPAAYSTLYSANGLTTEDPTFYLILANHFTTLLNSIFRSDIIAASTVDSISMCNLDQNSEIGTFVDSIRVIFGLKYNEKP